MRSLINTLAGAALLAVAPTMLAPKHHYGQTRYPVGRRGIGSSKYMPHQGKREIARRLRQAERLAAKRGQA